MNYSSSNGVLILVMACLVAAASAGNFNNDMDITFGNERAKRLNGGQDLLLSLDQYLGAGFKFKHDYLFGKLLKLVPGNSAGTVSTFYLISSQGAGHDEIGFEFLGNSSGYPYTIHTNVFAQGKGNKEPQFHLWFDPTARSTLRKSYGILKESFAGSHFQTANQREYMPVFGNAYDWATQGGRVKTDWTKAPFTAS